MTDLRARLANALKRHQFLHANHSSIGSRPHCLCGLRPRDQSEWADHVVADVLLSLPDIAIMELSNFEPVAKAIFANRRHHEPVRSWDDLYLDERNSYRAMASAALLAAANTAERAAH